MSKIDELTEIISGVAGKIDEAVGEAGAATQQTDEIAATAQSLGAASLAEGMLQVKDQIDALAETLAGASERAGEIQALARSVAEGT